jgi:hypothetical protein
VTYAPFRRPHLRHHRGGRPARLQLLFAERHEALEAGLGGNAVYMGELLDDIEAARAAYTGLAVTEIATLRGELGARSFG